MGKGKDDEGCVGFGTGGFLKQKKLKLFKLDSASEESLNKLLREHRLYYGSEYTFKYIYSDNPDKTMNKFLNKLRDTKVLDNGDVIDVSNSTASDILREYSKTGKLKTFGKEKKNSDDKKGKGKGKGKGKDKEKSSKSKKSKKSSDTEESGSDSESGSSSDDSGSGSDSE